MTARVVNPKGKFRLEWDMAMSRANRRCQSWCRYDERCLDVATEVIAEDGVYTAVCHECRLAGAGLTPGERGARTKSNRAKQLELFSTEREPTK